MKYALAVIITGILLCCGCGESSPEPSTKTEPLAQPEASHRQTAINAAPTVQPSVSSADGKTANAAKTKADEKADSQTLEATTMTFIGQLANEQFAQVTKDFDDTMKKAMPAEKLHETWTTVVGQVGKLKNQGRCTHTKVDNYDVVSVTCTFERAPLDVVVSFDRARHIAGLFFRPVQPATHSTDPRTAAELKTKTGTLYGTFDLPQGNGPYPVVVIIAGSGPTDRDGNQPVMKNDSLKLLGAGLAAHGIATLRYDKRGVGESAPAGGREEDVRFEMLLNDAAAWVEELDKDKRFAKVGIVGHSEGSLIGMLAAKQVKVDFFVSIAGMGRRFSELLREQLTKNLAQRPDLRKRSLQILDDLVAGRTVDDVPPELMAKFRPSVQAYVMSLFKYDPTKEIASLEMPVMIVQGTTDIQVSVEDAKWLATANKNAHVSIIDGMNHVMKRATTQPEQQAAYTDPSLPLAPKLLDEITKFLKE